MNTLSFVPSVILHSLQKDPVRDGEDKGEKPHCEAADLNDPGIPAGVHLGSMDDRQVAVQTDTGQEKDPTVEVNLRVQRNQPKRSEKSLHCAFTILHFVAEFKCIFPAAHLLP